MHLLAAIIFFVIGSVVAACDGDWSGVEFIIEVITGIALFFGIILIFSVFIEACF